MGLSNMLQQKMRAIPRYIETGEYARVLMDANDDIHVACSNTLCVSIRAS
jgi:hypothetical protein